MVHVCVENWLDKLQEKIRNYEPPDINEDEGEVAPKSVNFTESVLL